MEIEKDLLSLCKRALAEQRWDVADHLLAALETLSRTTPAAAESVEQAYLCVSQASATRRSADPQPTDCHRCGTRGTRRANHRPGERNR